MYKRQEKYQNNKADIQLSVRPYNKNLSIDRLRSHDQFAKKVKEYLETLKPEIVHCIIPCNSLCKTMSAYKKEHDVKPVSYTHLVVSGINLFQGGTLRVYYNFCDEIIQSGLHKQYHFILFVQTK